MAVPITRELGVGFYEELIQMLNKAVATTVIATTDTIADSLTQLATERDLL